MIFAFLLAFFEAKIFLPFLFCFAYCFFTDNKITPCIRSERMFGPSSRQGLAAPEPAHAQLTHNKKQAKKGRGKKKWLCTYLLSLLAKQSESNRPIVFMLLFFGSCTLRGEERPSR